MKEKRDNSPKWVAYDEGMKCAQKDLEGINPNEINPVQEGDFLDEINAMKMDIQCKTYYIQGYIDWVVTMQGLWPEIGKQTVC